MQTGKGSSYHAAGVDIDKGNQLVERIKPYARATATPGVLQGLGGFGALFELPSGYDHPVLVSATDGVGTKLKLAMQCQQHDTIGIDLVAMCANDLIVCGATPLFFLDYYATGRLQLDTAADVIKGIAEGCQQANMALVGGETAEMPGMYHGEDYDLAGFCVGVVEKSKLIDGQAVTAGDALIALPASGPHSNGYSLIRHVLDSNDVDIHQEVDGQPLSKLLLEPTRIYVASVLNLMETIPVHAMAHITGGGLTENLPRVLPESLSATLQTQSWQRPAIFDWLQTTGNIADIEMWRTFNCGVGMVLCVDDEHCEQALTLLQDAGEAAWQIGTITSREPNAAAVIFEE